MINFPFDINSMRLALMAQIEKLGAAARKKSATIKPSKGHSSGRFPMPDKKHARLALQMLPKAKGLSSDDKTKIRARANKMLGKGKGK